MQYKEKLTVTVCSSKVSCEEAKSGDKKSSNAG